MKMKNGRMTGCGMADLSFNNFSFRMTHRWPLPFRSHDDGTSAPRVSPQSPLWPPNDYIIITSSQIINLIITSSQLPYIPNANCITIITSSLHHHYIIITSSLRISHYIIIKSFLITSSLCNGVYQIFGE